MNGRYPAAYHRAASYLVAFGGYGPRPAQCRADLAEALRSLRRTHGAAYARRARYGLAFISGHFPDPPGRTWRPGMRHAMCAP